MESWDHAVKVPNGYVSNIVLDGIDLCEDWAKYQNDKNTKVFIQLNYSQQLLTIRQIILKTKIVYSVRRLKI